MARVPSLEGSLYLTDPQSIIGYQLRRYFRQPKDTIPLLDDMIISLPAQVAKFGKEPETLVANMQSDLQNVFDRIFQNERQVTVLVTHDASDNNPAYNVNISITYTTLIGEINQVGTTISLVKGRLVIPEDKIPLNFG